MPLRTPRPATAILTLVLVVVVVAATIALVVSLTDDGDDGRPSAAPATSSPTSEAPTTTLEPTTVPSNLSADQARTVDELKAQVSAIRGLEWKSDLPIRIVSPEEQARRLLELTNIEREKHPEDLPGIEAALKLLQLVPADFDYRATIDRLLAGGVLGFYDDEAKELFVRGDPDADLDVASRSTMVHELTHALTDQNFDFGSRNRELSDKDLGEESIALAAVLEGDAELVRTMWADEHLSSRERAEADLGGGSDPSIFRDMPAYVLDAINFPYTAGFDFVAALHEEGGFAAVDGAYRQPPTSTEEILHRERYVPGRTWTRPDLPDLAAATGCTAVDTGTIGEFDMTEVLDRQLPRAEAGVAAAGWNGDAYRLVRCGTTLGMVDRWQTDTPGDQTELVDALVAWARGWSGSDQAVDGDGRFSGPSGSGWIRRSPDATNVQLVIAGDASTFDRLAAAVRAA